ncbi:MAG: peptidase S10 [Ignavibacteria bacterium]|nr:peptidase S10 [Ignavibacteria bacterium]MBK7032899.1 peptidase S10 [Ignavibacteria bacterium]MBK7413598.1 peptidase S10 [Ignavibacteria bacterium]MBK9182835.1 peptidase S10 [Ignavibacteria bacterium]
MKLLVVFLTLGIVCSTVYAADSAAAKAALFQTPVTTKHSVSINGAQVSYEATAGHLTLLKEDGSPRAKVFFIAYTKTGVSDPATRPVTISFNGGPGSSSVWLHLGVLGPRRVAMNDDGTTLPPPYKLVDNDQSWLDMTDLVFIDPVSTGYSRANEEKDAKQFHGYNQDIESVGEFIRRWISDNKRWASPKYLIGESYGTTRASGLSEHLQHRYGMYLNGVILVSAVLNFQSIDFKDGNDLPFATFLPTYAATAWYHKKLSADMQALPLEQVVEQARTFAMGDYTVALMKGNALSASERTAVIDRIARYTGLTREYIDKAELRPVIFRYCQELLADSALVIGRFDSRYKGTVSDRLGNSMERDPSHHPTIAGCFSTCINDYLSRELNVSTTLPYEVLTGRVWPWDFSNVQNEYLNVAPSLREAMQMNPSLRVWVLNGYYDLATPFYGTEYTFSHMGLPGSLQKNIGMTYYPAGHMMYLLKPSLIQMKTDAKRFYAQ